MTTPRFLRHEDEYGIIYLNLRRLLSIEYNKETNKTIVRFEGSCDDVIKVKYRGDMTIDVLKAINSDAVWFEVNDGDEEGE